MKLAFEEIWEFIELTQCERYDYALHAGDIMVENISVSCIKSLRDDPSYDVELLPDVFTYREILWQPDVFADVKFSLAPLRVFVAYCTERVSIMENNESETCALYRQLISGLQTIGQATLEQLETTEGNVKSTLGEFRQQAFPILKCFIHHPKNKPSYVEDATKRLDYAVKIMLNQYHGKYTYLAEPYWHISVHKKEAIS